MSLVTIEVEFDNGRIVPREPAKLPAHGNGLLTILTSSDAENGSPVVRQRIALPFIQGLPGETINPTPEELDASLWG